MRTRKRVPPAASIAMLMATGIGSFEPGFGLLRDVAEHFGGGSVVEREIASDVAVRLASVESEGSHGPRDPHVRGLDHCMHVHGPAVLGATPVFKPLATRKRVDATDPIPNSDPDTADLFHPPRA